MHSSLLVVSTLLFLVGHVSSQKFTLPMLAPFFPHASDINLLELVQGLNNDTTVAARKIRINNWAMTNKKAGTIVNPTYTLYDNKSYAVKKAQQFMEYREGLKNFITKTIGADLMKDNFLTETQFKQTLPLFWMVDEEKLGSDQWTTIFRDYPRFGRIAIADYSKKEIFTNKMFDLARNYNHTDPLYKMTLTYETYEMEFKDDVLSKYQL